jgi:hypothetical protein
MHKRQKRSKPPNRRCCIGIFPDVQSQQADVAKKCIAKQQAFSFIKKMEREVTLGGNVCDERPSLMRTCANEAELRARDVAVVGSDYRCTVCTCSKSR